MTLSAFNSICLLDFFMWIMSGGRGRLLPTSCEQTISIHNIQNIRTKKNYCMFRNCCNYLLFYILNMCGGIVFVWVAVTSDLGQAFFLLFFRARWFQVFKTQSTRIASIFCCSKCYEINGKVILICLLFILWKLYYQ